MAADKNLKERILVIGLGTSGTAACRFLLRRGYSVLAVDEGRGDPLEEVASRLESEGVEVHLGCSRFPTDVDRVVVSPGVPAEKLTSFIEKNIPIIGELELGCREIDRPYIAVTGTNGKSTVVTNIEKALTLCGRKARAVGNLGTPITQWVDSGDEVDFVVLEASSYQLETIETFNPRIAVILNVSEDHMERHGSMEAYLAAKSRITVNQTIDDALVLHKDLSEFPELQKTRGRLYWYGRDLSPSQDGLSLGGDRLSWRGGRPEWSGALPAEGLFRHEIDNLLAVTTVLILLGFEPDEALRIFREPVRLPHRLEPVATVRGVLYVNDSKATNAHAAVAALQSIPGKVIWLVGGEGKGEDLSTLASVAAHSGVRLAVAFGSDARIFTSVLQAAQVPVEEFPSLRAAFIRTTEVALPGDTVLLSPAAASFDEFTSFEDRGNQFKKWVTELEVNAA